MSRVEPRENNDAREEERRKAGTTPGKAEGEESVADEALRKDDYDETLKIPQDRA